MRNFLFSVLIFFLLTPFSVFAQDCDGFYAFKKGTFIEMTNYDKKGKVTGVGQSTVIEQTTSGAATIATIESKYLDQDNKETMTMQYEVKCENNVLYIDMKHMMSPELMGGNSEMEMEVSGSSFELPSSLSAGQTLPDANMSIAMKSNGMTIMTMTMKVVERKVEAKESITTPAGTFEAYKISSAVESKTIFTVKVKTVEWYAKGIGTVKTESYNEKGVMTGYSLLTKFNQ